MVVGIASLRQFYTPVVLNAYKQKTPLLQGLMHNHLDGNHCFTAHYSDGSFFHFG